MKEKNIWKTNREDCKQKRAKGERKAKKGKNERERE